MKYKLSWRELLERYIFRMIMALPSRLILRLMGRRPIVIDGNQLDSEMQLILALGEIGDKPSLSDLTPFDGRKHLGRNARVHGLRISGVVSRDLQIPGDANGLINVRFYRRSRAKKVAQPLIVYFHGGGFVLGDIALYDETCRFICRKTGVQILSVEYRLAPEFPYPSGLNDCLAAYRWVTQHAVDLGADPRKLVIAGDSAGGNFAAIVSQIVAAAPELQPALQILFYPTCDRSKPYRSETLFGEGFLLNGKERRFFENHYLGITGRESGTGIDATDPLLSPIYGKNLGKLPPAVIMTAGFDPLRDEGEAYSHALQAAGTRCRLFRKEGMIHGFINMIGFSRSARRSFSEILRVIKAEINQL